MTTWSTCWRQSAKDDTVQVDKDGKSYFLPLGRFDNRVDKTSFIREDEDKWSSSGREGPAGRHAAKRSTA